MLVWTADVLFIKPLGKLRTNPITNITTIARQITGAIRVRLAINQEFRVACLDISLCVFAPLRETQEPGQQPGFFISES